jgi:hypothetical protein
MRPSRTFPQKAFRLHLSPGERHKGHVLHGIIRAFLARHTLLACTPDCGEAHALLPACEALAPRWRRGSTLWKCDTSGSASA